MPFALLLIGIVLVMAAANNTLTQLGQQLKKDFTGQGNFLNWLAAVGIVGSIGYIPQMRTLSRVFLGLICLAILMTSGRRGVFSAFQGALNSGGGSSATAGTPAPAVYPQYNQNMPVATPQPGAAAGIPQPQNNPFQTGSLY